MITVSIDGWNVSYLTFTSGPSVGTGCTLRVFKRGPDYKSQSCDDCDGRIFDTQEEAEQHALQHAHLKVHSLFSE